MNNFWVWAIGVTGICLLPYRWTRLPASALVGVAAVMYSAPALADQNLLVADNGVVECVASSKDLTRISLKQDKFASVSKISMPNEEQDFSVVNEPTRGDIYVSVPEGFPRSIVSFFGTTQKGFVYKFACRIEGEGAEQIFIGNVDLERTAEDGGVLAARSPKDKSIALVQAMVSQDIIPGYEIRQRELSPVKVGKMRVQMISEYRGIDLQGRTLRIENISRGPINLDQEQIASSDAIAFSFANSLLQPGQTTTAYIVSAAGDR